MGLYNLKVNKIDRKVWTDDKAFNEKIFSSKQAQGYKTKMNNLFRFSPGPTKTLNKKLPPMGDPDKDMIPNMFDKQPFIYNKNKVNQFLKNKIPKNKRLIK